MQRLTKLFFMVLFLFALSPLAVLANATIVVSTTTDEDVPNLFCSLREAIIAANTNAAYNGCTGSSFANDTITFSTSVFNTSQTITLTSDLPSITSNITITGPGSSLLTIDSDDFYRPFFVNVSSTTTVTISGMTVLDGGSTSGDGGGIYVNSGKVTVNNMVFTSNIASLTGGAIYVKLGATATVNTSSFQDNTATIGGAIYSDGTLRVSNSTFLYNHSSDYGGAITNLGANSVIGGSLFANNNSNISGGAYVGIGTIFNSTFSTNHANDTGGAIYNASAGTLKLIHVTATNGLGDNGGGGVYLLNGAFVMMNSILSGNFEGNCIFGGIATVNINYSLVEGVDCGVTNGVNGNLTSSALFDPNGVQNNGGVTQTVALSPASPGVNAGSNSYRMESNAAVNTDFNGDGDKADTLSTDQRGTGFPRTNNTTVDMGAFETNTTYTGLTVDTTSDAVLYSCTAAANDCSLRGAIMVANIRSGTDTISFASSVFSSFQTITLTSDLPLITSSLNINGPGLNLLTIDGSSGYRPFSIFGTASVSLSGMSTSATNSANPGGAVSINGGSLTVTNINFVNSFSNSNGGAIYASGASLSVSNSNFETNTANTSGGAIYVDTGGNLKVNNSSFDTNHANAYGGAIYSASPAYIGSSSFYSDTAAFGGGVTLNSGAISNSTFANHTATLEGGAVENLVGTLTLVNVTISNSAAGSIGAGVYGGDSNVFIFNSIIAYSTINGDCSTNAGTITVFNSIIEDGGCITVGVNGNIAGEPFLDPNGLQNNGGSTETLAVSPASPVVNAGNNSWLSEANVGAYLNGDGDTLDSLSTDQRGTGFSRTVNTTVDMGAFESPGGFTGLVVDTTSDTVLFNCTNAANDCSLRSAIELANARPGTDAITFDATVFSTVQTISLNGDLPHISSDINIVGPELSLTIEGNFSYRPFYIENNAVVSIAGLTVRHTASGLTDGAAIYMANGSLSLSYAIFSNNESAAGQGGVIYADAGSITINYVSFSQNLANNHGGAIAVNTATVTISNSSFANNGSTSGNGGAIYSNNGTVNISNSSINSSSANSGNGGAIYNSIGSLIIRDSSFNLNHAVNGGVIYTITDISVLDSLFTNNTADGGGGAIIAVNDFAYIVDSSFSGNTANYGGAIYGFVRAVNSSFAYNGATVQGGAMYAIDESIFLHDSSIGFNSAGSGGGVFVDDSDGGAFPTGSLEIVNTIIADSTGGGDCVKGADATFTGIASIIEDGGCGIVDGINGNIVDDPMFDVRGLHDNGGTILSLTLSPQSPAIDAGDPGPSNAFLNENGLNIDINLDGDFLDDLDYDQRGIGFPRLSGASNDMGVVEQTASLSLVVDTTSDTNLVICTSAPSDCSLRGAITVANAMAGANTITFDATVFATAQTITLTADMPLITESLTITGSGQNLLTISGADLYQPFEIDNSAAVTLSAMTISHGYTNSDGGAINVNDGDLTINNMNINNNHADAAGGAIYTFDNLTVSNSSFSNNFAESDGGAIDDSGSSARVTITNSSFIDNVSHDLGGAIRIDGNATISNSSFVGNSATNNGGAIFSLGVLSVGNSSFDDNIADFGGAIDVHGSSTSVIFNSSFYDNQANINGGGVRTVSDLALINVTIFSNSAPTGGGIYTTSANLTVMNTISVGNQGAACVTTTSDPTINNSLFDAADCGMVNGVNNNIVGQAFLNPVGLEDNGGTTQTIALAPLSPAVNTGNNNYLSEANLSIDFNQDSDFLDTIDTDQRGVGFNRINNTTVDMGAYESSGTFNGLVVDNNSGTTKIFCTTAPNDCSLSGAIFLANGIVGADTITFDGTVFGSAQTILLNTNPDTITGDLTITGPGINLLTVDVGANADYVFNIANGAVVTISNMALIGEDGNFMPLIYLTQGSLSVNNMSFSDNDAFSGAGIYANPSTSLVVNNSSFNGNSATSNDGGAINGATGSSVTVTNSSFSNNSTVNNGGAIFSDSAVYIANSSFSGNSALNGGAVYSNTNANITIGWSSFNGNTATANGGALYGDIDVFNSSIYSNTANGYAGAFYPTDTPTMLNVTMSANVAPTVGGIFVNVGGLNIFNSIVANSTGVDCVGDDQPVTTNYSLIEDGSCGITNGVNGNLTGAPYLGPFGNFGGSTNVLSWLPYSPVINAGNNAYLTEGAVNIDFNNDGDTGDTLDTDQRGVGFTRTIGTAVDMGAFEATPSTSVANVAPIRNYYSTSTPTLTWSRVSWATSYELQISTTTSFSALQCSGTISVAASNLSYTTCALSSGTYYWRVRAVSSTGPGAWSTVDVFVVGGP